jgi:hypothetical protein
MARHAYMENERPVECIILHAKAKVVYLSRGAARAADNELRQMGIPAARAYRCPACSYWHLATMREVGAL